MLASPDKQISLTTRLPLDGKRAGAAPAWSPTTYKVPVDTTNHLIVAHEVTNVGTDRSQLATMAQAAKAALRKRSFGRRCGSGYFKGEELLACEQAGVAVTLPKPQTSEPSEAAWET